jgi:hypothetical protein
MKSHLLPLVATLGAVGSFAIMLATQAAPPCCTNTEVTQQVQQTTCQNCLVSSSALCPSKNGQKHSPCF